jgi:hypothetical protein
MKRRAVARNDCKSGFPDERQRRNGDRQLWSA